MTEKGCTLYHTYHSLWMLCSDYILQIFHIYIAAQSRSCIRQPLLGQQYFCLLTANSPINRRQLIAAVDTSTLREVLKGLEVGEHLHVDQHSIFPDV